MYNTDRIVVNIEGFDFPLTSPDGKVEHGKQWATGYGGPRPNTLYNMGTDNKRKPFDIRRMFRNLSRVLTGKPAPDYSDLDRDVR